ncbi:AbrB/MazE/SpoVT family DNA-binding domain-containing protein [Halosimplex salinum]|uniref:AbrB/MazE/SpoVT family DNA-binding domain-containing protein n=1 Tax=Halosimplex salinum TaxID=1710538 RepID=UPI000F473A27|nr:AbrB/MazE/SpoVT family DNA-binding domain-containing protein [Halosimplex salinum]
MTEATLDDCGRLKLPRESREQYGERYRIVELHSGIKLVPVADDPLSALREEFADVDRSADELPESARGDALDEAGR